MILIPLFQMEALGSEISFHFRHLVNIIPDCLFISSLVTPEKCFLNMINASWGKFAKNNTLYKVALFSGAIECNQTLNNSRENIFHSGRQDVSGDAIS